MATARSATQVAHYSLHLEDLDMNPLIIQSVPQIFTFPLNVFWSLVPPTHTAAYSYSWTNWR
jgi:hypothetical protein